LSADAGHQLTELDSGIRVVTEALPSVRSVALGFWIGTGSRHERVEQAGVSHFLEHLLFKGTNVYSRFLDQHLERAWDVMSDMVLRPAYADVDSERQVVIEEIAMYEDEPSDKVHDVLADAVFGDHPLGRPIIGTAEVVGSVPVPEIASYHDSRYVGSNLVLAAAGNISHDRIVELVQQATAGLPRGDSGLDAGPPASVQPRACFHQKTTEQYHLCLGGPGISRGDDRRFILRVLDTILGGSSSSRLFQEVREKRGLAYAVYSYTSQYVDTGQMGIYVGTRPDRASEALDVIATELRRIVSEPVPEDELERAKENVKGRTALSFESTLTRMNRLGSAVLTGVPVLSLDEIVAAIEAVTADDVAKLAGELLDPSLLSAAGVGGDEAVFRRALEPVSDSLALAA
jgi:predicted Zn-dependent peptidase